MSRKPPLAAVYMRAALGMQLGLEPIRNACERCGSPHKAFRSVHIAGTNGKGSVAAMTAHVLRLSGYRVGLFTSPHLQRFAERMQVNGEPISDAELAAALDEALRIGPDLSFFETAFLTAMLAFREARIDLCVLEVGLGGRLDATNIVEGPLATAITRIALDHTRLLGDTLEEIAGEKAAIAKPGVPMVLGSLEHHVDRVLRAHAGSLGAGNIFGVGREIPVRVLPGHTIEVALPGFGEPLFLKPSLRGQHQLHNAALAAALCGVVRSSHRGVTRESILTGIETSRWPARLESLDDGQGEVLIDAAHNPDGVTAVAQFVVSTVHCRPVALVFGAMADKAWPAMMDCLAPLAQHRYFVEPPGRRPAPLDEMAGRFDGVAKSSIRGALEDARRCVGPEGLVLVTGSVFLAASARALLLSLPTDPPVAL